MGLSNKQKKYIRDHYKKKNADTLSRELKTDTEIVRDYINEMSPEAGPETRRIFLIITLLIPVFFFIALESGLRLFNYRGDTSLFIFPEEYFEGEYGLPNRNFNARYFFNTTNIPGFSNDAFLVEKPDTSFRVFVMGGSSTAGYPYGFNGMFSRVTADVMRDVMPGHLVEVVNLGTSAVNTYSLYDQIPEILNQKPDAIFMYTGHNEFYGALGVGSSEQIGAFPGFVRTYLKLQRLKTFLLIRDFIASTSRWITVTVFGNSHPAGDGTLMQRMVQDQAITLDSRSFELGKRQFESNLDKILETFQKAGIPVYISSIASNLKDQEPFISLESDSHPLASDVYEDAQMLYNQGEFEQAYRKYVYARDLDALKFRAPEVFNKIIRETAVRHDAYYVPAYEVMKEYTNNGIIGFDLMLEHLHPNDTGYFLIGKAFYEAFEQSGFLGMEIDTSGFNGWDHYFQGMKVTSLDHRVAYHRIRFLTSGWPFIDRPDPEGYPYNYEPENFIDEVAFEVVHSSKRWDQAKLDVAQYLIENGYIEDGLNEYFGLIRDQPYNDSPYVYAGRVILQILHDFDRARPYFEQALQKNPSNFTARMLGSIEVNDGNYERGIELLEKALELNPDDAQAMFNLSGALAMNGDLESAYEKALELESLSEHFPGLQDWKRQLQQQLGRNR